MRNGGEMQGKRRGKEGSKGGGKQVLAAGIPPVFVVQRIVRRIGRSCSWWVGEWLRWELRDSFLGVRCSYDNNTERRLSNCKGRIGGDYMHPSAGTRQGKGLLLAALGKGLVIETRRGTRKLNWLRQSAIVVINGINRSLCTMLAYVCPYNSYQFNQTATQSPTKRPNQTPSFIHHPSSPISHRSLHIAHLHLRIHHLIDFLIRRSWHSLLLSKIVNLYRYTNEDISPPGTNQ